MTTRVKTIGRGSRVVALFLAIIVSIGYVPLTQPAYAAEGTYTTFTLYESGDYDQVFALSDLHLTEGTGRAKFAQLLQEMDKTYDPDMLIFCGDQYVDSYSSPSAAEYPDPVGVSFTDVYQEIRTVANYYLDPDPAIVFTTGNHDSDAGNSYFTNNSGFSSYYGLVPTQNFDVFLFGSPAGVREVNSTEQIDALDTYLGARADKSKPVIVASHYPIDDITANTEQAASIQAVLAKYDQPIFFLWGHSHTEERIPGADFSNLFKKYPRGYSTVNAGSIIYRGGDDAVAQGLAMTFDYYASTLDFDMIRISTTSPDTSTESGSRQVTIWDGTVADGFLAAAQRLTPT